MTESGLPPANYPNLNPALMFNVAKNTNENYLVKIQYKALGVEIIADMPEQMSYAMASEWENRLPSSVADALGGAGDIASAVAGTNAVHQGLTTQVWQGTSAIEIPISLLFDAETSALNDVYKPMRILETMVLPEVQFGYLVAPGPSGLSNNGGIDVTVGNTVRLKECILVSCSTTYNTRLGVDGYPISGQAELTFRTNRVYGKREWLAASNLPESLLAR